MLENQQGKCACLVPPCFFCTRCKAVRKYVRARWKYNTSTKYLVMILCNVCHWYDIRQPLLIICPEFWVHVKQWFCCMIWHIHRRRGKPARQRRWFWGLALPFFKHLATYVLVLEYPNRKCILWSISKANGRFCHNVLLICRHLKAFYCNLAN